MEYNYNAGERDEYQDELDDMLLQQHMDEVAEEKSFKDLPKHGYQAPAYKKRIDNMEILKLYRRGYSIRKTAKALSCSPSTVRLRLQALIRTGMIT